MCFIVLYWIVLYYINLWRSTSRLEILRSRNMLLHVVFLIVFNYFPFFKKEWGDWYWGEGEQFSPIPHQGVIIIFFCSYKESSYHLPIMILVKLTFYQIVTRFLHPHLLQVVQEKLCCFLEFSKFASLAGAQPG